MSEPSLSELIEQLANIRIQEARVLDQIEQTTRREQQRTRATHATTPGSRNVFRGVYSIGDRVQITNGVREGQSKTGIVTGITATRVSITTDDGSRTWRAHGNLKFVSTTSRSCYPK